MVTVSGSNSQWEIYLVLTNHPGQLRRMMLAGYDRAIGTFSRALDSTSAVRQPSLHMSAAAASRDITLVCLHLSSICSAHNIISFK